jgi:hypothetical protein
MRFRDRFLPIFATGSIAISFLVNPAHAATYHSHATSWELHRETESDIYILDSGLTLKDCASAAVDARDEYPDDEIVCARTITDEPATDEEIDHADEEDDSQ